MACLGRFAVSNSAAGASLNRSQHLQCFDGDGSCRVSHLNSASKTLLSNSRKSENLLYGGKRAWFTPTRHSHAMPWNSGNGSANNWVDVDGYRGKLEALLYCGKSIPEEKIDKPTGLPAEALPIGDKPKCFSCEAKGAVECATCTGTGLYVDAVLESQGVIVRVKCLGCGGSGSTMCPKCGGRGHV